MAYETKLTRMTPEADLSLESIELQIQQKMELEQVQQYLNETFAEETEIPVMNPEAALEAYGVEMLHTIAKNKQAEEQKREDQHQ